MYKWCIALIGCFILSVSYGLRWSFGIFCNPMCSDLAWSRTKFSLAMSIHMLVFAFLSPIAGGATDKFGFKPVLFLGTVFFGAGLYILSFVHDLWSLYFVYGIIVAIGSCGLGLVPNSLMVGKVFERKGMPIGITTTGTSIGPLFLAPFSTFLILGLGWRETFAILGGSILIILFPLIQFGIRNNSAYNTANWGHSGAHRSDSKHTNGFNKKVLKNWFESFGSGEKQYWPILAGYFACCFSYYLICFHLPGLLAARNVPEMRSAAMLGTTTATGVFGKLLAGAAADRTGTVYLTILFLVLEAIGIFGMIIAFNLLAYYCAAILLGLSFGGIVSLIPITILESFNKELQGRALGVVTLSGAIGGSVGPFVGGIVYDMMNSFVPSLIIGASVLMCASGWLAMSEQPLREG